ncbi:unnamed protein product, partial [Rotaria sp. Silwood2]
FEEEEEEEEEHAQPKLQIEQNEFDKLEK